MTPYIGEIRMFAGSKPPAGWLLCNGTQQPIQGNEVLFSLIGTLYGGDGKTTFAVPNLCERVPIGIGQGPGLSPYFLGEAVGEPAVVLQEQHLPSHNHFIAASTAAADTTSPAYAATFGSVSGVTVQDGNTTNPLTLYQDPPASPQVALNPASIGTVGGNAHSNLMPSFYVMFIICTGGVFPAPSN